MESKVLLSLEQTAIFIPIWSMTHLMTCAASMQNMAGHSEKYLAEPMDGRKHGKLYENFQSVCGHPICSGPYA